MDSLKGLANQFSGGNNQTQQTQGQTMEGQQQGSSSGGGFFGGIGNKMNEAAGGGQASEKNEDYLDKGAYSLATNMCSMHTCSVVRPSISC